MNKRHNFFLSLFKYKPEGERKPEENFLTEAFVFLLRLEDGKLLKFLLKKILKENASIRGLDKEVFQVETFRSVKKKLTSSCKYVDISITSKDIAVYIENKIESGVNYSRNERSVYKPQTEFYKDHLRSSDYDKCRIKKLVTITKYPQEKGEEDIAILWEDIYGWINEWIRQIPNRSNLKLVRKIVLSFLQFLEELKMKPLKLLNSDLEVEKRANELKIGIKQISEYIAEQIKDKYGWKISGKSSFHRLVEYEEFGTTNVWGSSNIKTSNGISFRFYLDLHSKGWIMEIDFHFRENKKKINRIRECVCNSKHKYIKTSWEFYKFLKLPKDFCKYESKKQKKVILRTITVEIEKLAKGKGRLLVS
jgi:hypothetical protein